MASEIWEYVTRLYEHIDKITQLIFKYKQATIIISTLESKYMVVPHATKEAIWHKQVINGLGFPISKATMLFWNKQSCKALTKYPRFHD